MVFFSGKADNQFDNTAVQVLKAVSAYFTSKQLLHVGSVSKNSPASFNNRKCKVGHSRNRTGCQVFGTIGAAP